MHNQSIRRFPALFALAVLAAAVFAAPSSAADPNVVPGHYIVVLEDSVEKPGDLARAQVKQRDGELGFLYSTVFKGYSAELSPQAVEALRKDPRVKAVRPDHRLVAAAQTNPTGIGRTFATLNGAIDIDEQDDAPVDVDIAVLDTGIDEKHPDLDVVARTYCTGTKESAKCTDNTGTDENGHGTHVAGTAAAIDNGEGVVGVAPGARLWSVKVLDPGAFESELIAGIKWVTDHASQIEVANMSIGCNFLPCSLPSMAEALSASVDKGIVYVVAAGNNFSDAKLTTFGTSPDVITVSALADFDGKAGGAAGSTSCRKTYESEYGVHKDDSFAKFSNRGTDVEIAAPGVCIRSTVPGGGYEETFWWGTSMASPHVAGAAAILAAKSNPESAEDVEAIRDTLIEAGNLEWEDTSGDGVKEPLLDVSDEELFDQPNPPSATTQAASGVDIDNATLKATVVPNGLKTTYQFEYGLTTSYGTKVPIAAKEAGSGEKGVEVAETLSFLKGGTTYHYRVLATNADGTVQGKDEIFTTEIDPRFLFSFGKAGTEGGQFKSPMGIAFTADASAWVIDSNNHRVQKFNAKGEYLSKFGASGTGNGQLKSPQGIAIDASGNIWVADAGNKRVQKFNSKGEYLSQFGKEGSGNGQFMLPSDISIDASGNLWVTDVYNHRVQKFNSKGEYLAQTTGAPEGLVDPYGIAIDASGDLWVVDYAMSHIVKFNSKGEFQSEFGEGGEEASQLLGPYDVAIDAQGNLWVTDSFNNRVQKFSPGGEHLNSFGAYGSGAGQFISPSNLAIDPEGNLWVADLNNFRVQVWKTERPSTTSESAIEITETKATLRGSVNPNGLATSYRFEYGPSTAYGSSVPVPEEAIGSGTANVKVAQPVSGLEPGTTYHYRVVATNAEGIAYGKDLTFAAKPDPRFAFDFGSPGTGDGQFTEIHGIEIDASGNLWVADYGRIQKFNSSGVYQSQFEGKAGDELSWPHGIESDSSGNLWVADTGNNRIAKFSPKGEFLAKFGTEGEGNGQLIWPYDVAVDSSGNLWVADTANQRIQKFNAKGEFLAKYGSFGTGNGQFEEPAGIAIDASGNVWVLDANAARIQKFNSQGEYLSQFGSKGSGNGQFGYPQGIEIDSSGNVWVTDSTRVQKFNSKGEYLEQFGVKGEGLGQFRNATAIAAGSAGSIWVADNYKLEVQKWVP